MIPQNKQNLPMSGAQKAMSTSGFQPYLVAMKKINKESECVDGAPEASEALQGRVEVIDDDGVVTSISVRCACGEVTVIDCNY